MAKFGAATSAAYGSGRRQSNPFEVSTWSSGGAVTEPSASEVQREARQFNFLEGAGEPLVRDTLLTNREKAAKLRLQLEAAGITSGDNYDETVAASETGFMKGLGFLGNVLENIDKPLRTVKAGILDVLQLDQKIAGEDIEFFDAAKAIWSGDGAALNRAVPRELLGEDNDFSTDNILTQLGWESEGANWMNKTLRFGAHAAVDIGLDPISWATGGLAGVSKKAASASAMKLVDDASSIAIRGVREGVEEGTDASVTAARELIEQKSKTKLNKLVGDGVEGGLSKDEAVEQAWEAIRREAADELMAPVGRALANRDFAAMPAWVQASDMVTKAAPYLKGGIRISTPLGAGMRNAIGKPLPGTVGLGRKITAGAFKPRTGKARQTAYEAIGDGLKGSALHDSRLGKQAQRLLGKFDTNAPILNALRRGTVEGVNEARFMMDATNQIRTNLGLRDVERTLGRASNDSLDAMQKLSEPRRDEVNGIVRRAIQHGRLGALDDELPEYLQGEARQAVVTFGRTFRDTMEFIGNKWRAVEPDMGYQDNYMPLIFSDAFSDTVQFLARHADEGLPVFDNVPEHLQEGMSMLSEIVAARQRRIAGGRGKMVGDRQFLNERHTGLEVTGEIQEIGSVQLLRGVGVDFADHDTLNDQLMEALQWVAARENFKLKEAGVFSRKDMKSALEMDPLAAMNQYMNSMSAGLTERHLIKEMLNRGMLKPADFRASAQRTLAASWDNLNDEKTMARVQKVADRLIEVVDGAEGRVAEPYAKTKTVNLGGSMGTIELPAEAVEEMTPLLRRRIEEAKTRARAWEAAKTTRERRSTELYDRLVGQGVDHQVAAGLAGSTSASDMRAVLRQAIRDADDAAREVAAAVDQVGARLGTNSHEATMAYRAAHREAVRTTRTAERIAAESRRKLERQVDREIRRLKKGRPTRMRFDTEESRTALIDQVIPNLTDDLATRGAPQELVDGVSDILRRLVAGEDPAALSGELRSLRDAAVESLDAPVSTNTLESAAELARDAARGLERAGLIDSAQLRIISEAPLTKQGVDDSVFDLVAAAADRITAAYRGAMKMGKGRQARYDELTKLRRQVEEVEEVIRQLASKPAPDQSLRDWLQGDTLLDNMEVLRRLALNENVMHAPRRVVGALDSMLKDLGLLGEGKRLHRSKNTRIGFEILGEPEEFATVGEMRAELRRLGVKQLSEVGPDTVERLSEAARRTWAQLDELPAHVQAMQNLETTIREGTRLAELTVMGRKVSAEGIMKANAKANRTWLDFEQQVLRPFKRKTASVAELDAAQAAFHAQYPALRKILAPSEVAQLDVFADELGRRAALRQAGTSPEYREAVDAINLYKQTMFDEETTAESLKQLSEQVVRLKAEATTAEAARVADMLGQIQETFAGMLGMTRDADGNVVRRVLNDEERVALEKMVDRGKKLWAQIDDLGPDPFDLKVVPLAERAGFVPPSVHSMGGSAWDGMVGDRYATEWLGNMMAMTASMYDAEVMTSMTRNFRHIMSWWKAQATVARPTFHIRNAIGGFWNGTYADVRMSNYRDSIHYGPKFMHDLQAMSMEEALDRAPERLRAGLRWADNVGVFDDMFATTEIIDRQLKRRTKQRFNPLSQSGPAVRAGSRVMMDLESSMRLAVFFRHFDSAAPNPQASARAAKGWVDAVHFNYNELTQGEKWVRTMVPFFVWTRRNLPLQMRTLIERPQYLRRYQHLINAADSWNDTEADDLPGNRYRNAAGLHANVGMVNGDSDFWSTVVWDPDLPINILFELDQPFSSETWMNLLTNQLGPQFDMLSSFQEFGNAEYYATAPGGIGQMLNLLPLPGADRTGRGIARLESWASPIYRTVLPAATELGGFALETDPRRRQALGQLPDPDVEGDTAGSDLAAAGFTLLRGLGIQLEGVDDSYSNAAVTGIRLDDIRRELLDRGVLTPETKELADDMSKEELAAYIAQIDASQAEARS